MNHTVDIAFAVLAVVVACSMPLDTQAQTCDQPLGGGTDNVAWAWGSNYNGELGDGTTTERLTAVRVQNLSGLLTVAAGGGHSMALKNDHTVWTWGLNSNGQLGDGTVFARLGATTPGANWVTAPPQIERASAGTEPDGG